MKLSGKPCIRKLQKKTRKLAKEIEKLPPVSKPVKKTKTTQKKKR